MALVEAGPAEITRRRGEIGEDLERIAQSRCQFHRGWTELQGDRRKLYRERLELQRDLGGDRG